MIKLCSVLLVLSVSICLWSEKLTVWTEDFPPYNYRSETIIDDASTETIMGISTEIVRAILDEANVEYEIILASWSRSMLEAKTNPNALIYSTGRSPEREESFYWITEIVPTRYFIYKLKNRADLNVREINDVKKYLIGCTSGDIRESYFLKKGFKAGENLMIVYGEEANQRIYEMLKSGSIDFMPLPEAVAKYLIETNGDRDTDFDKALELKELEGKYWLAANKQTSQEIVRKIESAALKLRSNGKIERIMQKWRIGKDN